VIVLIDAHALLWWMSGSKELSAPASQVIADPANDALISAAMIWEIEIKRNRGKLRTPPGILDALEARISLLPITGEDAVAAAGLPPHHRDPFDRMLVAQALRLDATIVSRDRTLDAYGAHRLDA
jgi:PIN domain nuclease of toxin-antitoxin system